METPETALDPSPEPVSEIARGASWIALGNIASRVLGYVREAVKAGLFGTGAHVDIRLDEGGCQHSPDIGAHQAAAQLHLQPHIRVVTAPVPVAGERHIG
mgnify:CR=1 FL=1